MRIQQTHPHPVLSPDGSHLVFTSDGRTGYGNVFLIRLAGLDLSTLPPTRD
jgi:Tol biopolymer transport system component